MTPTPPAAPSPPSGRACQTLPQTIRKPEPAVRALAAGTFHYVLGAKIDSLEQQVAPDYRQIMDGLGEVDPNSAEGQKLREVFEPLQEQCK
jgi:hypothetical protein